MLGEDMEDEQLANIGDVLVSMVGIKIDCWVRWSKMTNNRVRAIGHG